MRVGLYPLLAAVLSAHAADLRQAVVIASAGDGTAAAVLTGEVEKRSGIRLARAEQASSGQTVIRLQRLSGLAAEAYRLSLNESVAAAEVTIAGADARGVLYGVGALLRKLDWAPGRLELADPLEETSAPRWPIRGHQLGYRATANSYDAWSVAQYEQYIRELALFGVNAIENIPFHERRPKPLMKLPQAEMNRAISAICDRYGLDYWVWTPASVDLKDPAKRAGLLQEFDVMLAESVRLDGIFVPGGDPGNNPPELLLPFLAEVAARARQTHPRVGVWVSLQGFSAAAEEYAYQYIERERPRWLTGLVAGPSSPPVARTRARLPREYKLRLYPDLTHNKICQYQVPEWDQAYALTLGREAPNPRPAEFALIHNRFAPASDGFLSYSDGVHDDVNKIVWSALAWDPERRVRDILAEYARVFFAPALAVEAADAILALERNWRGPLRDNGGVEATLREWQRLERQAPQLAGNWRWQLNLLRANYDAFVRRRLLAETELEAQANAILLDAERLGANAATDGALAVLNRAVEKQAAPELRARIVELCAALFQSIGLQTSVEKYHASGAERGAVLDFIDYPLNNRWWLEDEFKKVRAMADESARVARLRELALWERPGPGSYYDNVGNQSKAPHAEGDADAAVDTLGYPEPTFWWWAEGRSRARLSWQATLWPRQMVYDGLDPAARYVLRTSGYGRALPRFGGKAAEPTRDGREMGEIKEFPVPADAVKDGRLVVTFEIPAGEEHLNWRRRSRLSEVWLKIRDSHRFSQFSDR